ncbi:hypothetical protein OG618_37650 (plasmid) [Kitasatospora sp. NBC_01246]|uniref:hypothetical protein n=1 Tax=Kitasatospora sp. NBC_01246 TaxID=2903570 RepID=UPI002E2FED3E|nr:hypothetical protein [Kitasatospora sp. NBC_01246]
MPTPPKDQPKDEWSHFSSYAPEGLQTQFRVVCDLLGIERREGLKKAMELFVAKNPPEKLLQRQLRSK